MIILVNEYSLPYMQEVFVHFTEDNYLKYLAWYMIIQNVVNCYIFPKGQCQGSPCIPYNDDVVVWDWWS